MLEDVIPMALLGVIGLLCIAFIWIEVRDYRRMKGEREYYMTKAQRRELKTKVADLWCDTLEDAIHKGVIDRATGNLLYRRVAFQLGIWDLHPRKLKAPPPTTDEISELKERIKKRLGTNGKSKLPEPDLTLDNLLTKFAAN